jgi:hypothetical protein
VAGKLRLFIQKNVAAVEAYSIDYDEALTLRSGSDWEDITTVYYDGTAHNTHTTRASRGTSASADYLDEDDVIKSNLYQARDGAGTWGNAASIDVVAIADHVADDTPAAIVLSTAAEGSDTLTEVARAFVYNYFGFLNFPMLRTKMFNFFEDGTLNVAMGYLGGIDSNLSGITIFDLAAGSIPLMFGMDGLIYFGGSSGVYQHVTWRVGGDSSDYLTFDQYNPTPETWSTKMHHDGTDLTVDEGGVNVTSGDLNLADGDVVASADDAFYLGDPDTDGTWRIIRDGNNLVHQRRESSAWVTKQTITP